MVIATHPLFKEPLLALKELRESQGLSVALVDLQDVYKEFSFGSKNPRAIQDFLRLARSRWRTPPRFLLLVGDATFDPLNHLGLGDFDFAPTKLVDTQLLETASDDWFSDLEGDGHPRIAVGRLPVRTVEEARTVVGKIMAYESAPGGAWRNEALLVADRGDIFDFEGASRRIEELLPGGMSVQEIFLGQLDPGTARAELLSGLNSGKLLVNYVGHGSVESWSKEALLTSAGAQALQNGSRLPVVLVMNCLNGFFHDLYTDSLAESLLLSPQGGAAAVWASSGLTTPEEQAVMNEALVRLLFQGDGLTLGEAALRAKAEVTDPDLRHTWILFGDPATRLR